MAADGDQRATLIGRQSYRSPADRPPVERPIRLAVIGLGPRGRGNVVGKALAYAEYELAAVCDRRANLVAGVVDTVEREHGRRVPGFTDYERMLREVEPDAVAVTTDVDVQIPIACAAMESGCHAMVEVPLCTSIEDCWRVVTTAERTGKVFLLMEQVRFSGYIRAWRRIVDAGVIGKPLFVEGEYFSCKGGDAFFQDAAGRFHYPEHAAAAGAAPTWRHTMPTIVYLPHELSPLLYVIDDRVTRVVAMSTRPQSYRHPEVHRADLQVALMHTAGDVVLRMAVGHSSAAMPRDTGGGESAHWHHVKGSAGVLEWNRTPDGAPKLWVEDWEIEQPISVPWTTTPRGAPPEAAASGHGGRDYYVFAQFADAVLHGVPVELDAYAAADTAAPAILAAVSIDCGNAPQDVPDFRPGPERAAGELPAGVRL